MGLFDVSSQRRTVNLRRRDPPASECAAPVRSRRLPRLLEALDGLIARVEKSKPSHPALLATLNEDRERFQAGAAFPAVDRYLALIYPQMATAADYLPEDAVVLFCESPRVAERAKHYLWRLEEDVKTLLEGGQVSGELAVYARTMEELCRVLGDYPVCFLDAFASSSYPCGPGDLDVMAKQLPLLRPAWRPPR